MALQSRTAEYLFWVGRYVERAENMARLLDAGKRINAVPGENVRQSEWEPILSAAGVRQHFDQYYDEINQRNVVDFIGFSESNPSSIVSTIRQARENARAIRTAFTIDMWEALNEFWLSIEERRPSAEGSGTLAPFLDWVKQRCALFRGVADSTFLRYDCYDFLRMGTFVERADCTARLLDVKYFALLRPDAPIAGGVDTYQWTVILRATSSLRSYNWSYRSGYDPRNIAEFLILNPHSARSLAYCMEKVSEHLNRLARLYADRHDSHEICSSIYTELTDSKIDDVFAGGLHEFLTRFIARNNWLAAQIARDYYFTYADLADRAQNTPDGSEGGQQTQTQMSTPTAVENADRRVG